MSRFRNRVREVPEVSDAMKEKLVELVASAGYKPCVSIEVDFLTAGPAGNKIVIGAIFQIFMVRSIMVSVGALGVLISATDMVNAKRISMRRIGENPELLLEFLEWVERGGDMPSVEALGGF